MTFAAHLINQPTVHLSQNI